MSRHPAQELKETVQESQLPSTEQITKGIDSTKEAIHSELQKRSPISAEQKVGKDAEQLLETSKQFLEEKNKGDIVQKLIYDANKAVDELTELFQKHPFFIEKHKALLAKQEALDLGVMAKQNLKLMRDLLITLVQSPEFRGLLQDFVKLIKGTYEKETANLPTMKPESRSMTEMKEEVKEKGLQTFDAAKQIYTDYKEGTVMPEDKKQQVKQQFISLIKSMAKEENYVNSINGIFQILDQAQFLAQRVKDEAQGQMQEIQTPSLNAMWSDSKTFLINFAGEGAVDVMVADYNDLYDTISSDTLLMNFISDFKNFIIDALKNPSMIDTEEFNTRYEDIYQRGQGYINDTRYQQKFHKLYNDVIVLLECIKTDTTTQQLGSDVSKLARDLFLDEQGRPSLNIMSSGLTNLRSLVAPILKKNLENVPIFGISGEDDTYKWRIDQLTLNMSELVPDNIEMKVWGAANVSIATTKAEAVTYITMWIKNVGVEAKDLKFNFQRKSFPKLEEEGVADFSVTGRNQLKITWKVLGLQDEPWTFSIHEVKCLLDNVDIKIKESTHTFLMKMITSLFSGTIKRNIEHKIESNIVEGLDTVNSQLNAAVKST